MEDGKGLRVRQSGHPAGNKYSPAEDEIIRQHYPEGGQFACFMLLPERSMPSISSRAALLGVRYLHPKRSRGRVVQTDLEVCGQGPERYRYLFEPLVKLERLPVRAGAEDFRALPSLR